MSDAEKKSAGGEIPYPTGFQIVKFETGYFFVMYVVDVLDHGIGQEVNPFVMLRPIEHDLRSSKSIAAVNHGHLRSEARKEQRLLHGGITSTDDHNFLSRKKEAIAGGARRNPVTYELLFVRQTQPTSRRSAGNNQRLGMHLVFAEMKQKRTLAKIGAREMPHSILRAEALCLLAHVLDQLRTENAFWKSRKVFDQRCKSQLSI